MVKEVKEIIGYTSENIKDKCKEKINQITRMVEAWSENELVAKIKRTLRKINLLGRTSCSDMYNVWTSVDYHN